MKKTIAIILLLIFICFATVGLTEETSFLTDLYKKGDIIVIFDLPNKIDDTIIENYIQIDDKSVYFYLNKLELYYSNTNSYGLDVYYFNSQNTTSISKKIDYDELKNITTVLTLAKEYLKTYNNDNSYQIKYISKDDIEFMISYGEIDIKFDTNEDLRIKDVETLDKLLNYFENIDNMIDTYEENKQKLLAAAMPLFICGGYKNEI